MEVMLQSLTKDQMIELGMDLVVQCIKFDVIDELDKPYIILNLNVLGVIYGVQIPKHEINEKNIKDGWTQVIEQFGVMHMKGQKYNIQDGHRDLTDEELQIVEEANNGKRRNSNRNKR